MADKISGKIQYLNEKEGKFGKSYNIKVDGTAYYLQGKYPPRGIDAGDYVEFETQMKGNFPVVVTGSLRKVEASTPPPAAAGKPAAFKAASSYDDRQDVISKQAALNTALAFLEFAKANETLPVPKQKNAGYGYLKAIWFKEAAELYELNTGKAWEFPEQDVEEEAPKPQKKPVKKAAPAPEPEDEYEDDSLDSDEDAWV